ncbi:MAG: NTP transferase domain-containing protein [Clostridia bacterium]|nr:NTP transferase domain-containing protein [Clostridia bacterium]
MKCLILAAGYATRLYPLTENFPKSLLKVQDKTILDHLVDDIDTMGEVDEYVIISNHKFFPHFTDWANAKAQKITVIDDGTTSNDNRLGAVKDIEFAIDSLKIDDDMLIIAGDNVLDFSLTKFITYAKQKDTSCVMRYFEGDKVRLTKSGVLTIDHSDRVINMVEKPAEPQSNWCCPPFYFYKAKDSKLIAKAIEDGCGTDAPGSYVAWLCSKTDVHAMEMPGKRYDIGNLESYKKVQEEYKGIC